MEIYTIETAEESRALNNVCAHLGMKRDDLYIRLFQKKVLMADGTVNKLLAANSFRDCAAQNEIEAIIEWAQRVLKQIGAPAIES